MIDDARLLEMASDARLISPDCQLCAKSLCVLWLACERGLQQNEVLPLPGGGGALRPGAWRRIRARLSDRGHDHRADQAADMAPLVEFFFKCLHDERDPDKLPTPPQVPAVFADALPLED